MFELMLCIGGILAVISAVVLGRVWAFAVAYKRNLNP